MSKKLTKTSLPRTSNESRRISNNLNSPRASINGKTKSRISQETPLQSERNSRRASAVSATEIQNEVQSTPIEANENVKRESDERRESEKKKCFDDWREFYLQIFGSVKRKSDLVIAFTHYILMKNGFRCLGLGDDRTYSENETGDIYMPEGWNHFPKYAIRYIYNRMLHILIAIELDHRLLINFLNTRTNVVSNIIIFPEMTVRSTCGGNIHMLIPFPEKLAQNLYSNLMQTFTDMQACDRPKIMSRTKHLDSPWDELTRRRTKDVYSILEEDNVTEIEESQNVQAVDNENKRFDSSYNAGAERTSWADIKPQTANAELMGPLNSRLDETAEPVKEAIVSYVEAMVNNWFRLYGTEIMKSGKTAIQDLAEQREMIEKYMNFVKPVAEPKKGFVIYNSRVTLDDGKHMLFRESVKKSSKDMQSDSNARTELTKSLTETAQQPSKVVVKPGTDVDFRCDGGVDTIKVEDKSKFNRNLNNYRHAQPKVSSGIRKAKITQKPLTQSTNEPVEQSAPAAQNDFSFKYKHIQPKVFSGKKVLKSASKKKLQSKLVSSLSGQRLLENEIKKAYDIPELNTENRSPESNRKKGGSNTNSTTKNSSANNEGKSKRKRYKLETNASLSKGPNHNASKQSGKSSIDVAESSPLKKIRFNLPSNLNTNWPGIYKNLETLLKTSFPFSDQTREGGGGGDLESKENLNTNNTELKNNLTEIVLNKDLDFLTKQTQQKPNKKQKNFDLDKRPKHASYSTSLLQTIEEHFADQIEAKRLELLDKVRGRHLIGIMDNNEDLEMKNKFLNIENESKEKDVGYFVQPADEWSQWEFKKRLREIQERRVMGSLHNNNTSNYVE